MNQARCVFFAAICLLFVAQSKGATKVDKLKLLCSNQRVSLTNLSQLEQFVETIETQKKYKCPKSIRKPLKSLVALIRNDSNKNVCSQEKADEIVRFYGENGLDHLHKDLRKLYLAYGLKVSSVCRKSMVDELVKVRTSGLLSQEDFSQLNGWTDQHSTVARLMNEPKDYEDLILPKHFVGLMKARANGCVKGDDDDYGMVSLFLLTPTNGTFSSIQWTCRNRFKPIYDQLIVPLLTLSNFGFNYRDKRTTARDELINREVFQWYRIVFVCETLNDVEFIEDPNEPEKGKIRLLTKKEAKSLAASMSRALSDEGQRIVYTRGDFVGNSAIFDQNNDQLLDLKDKSLLKAIAKYKQPSERLGFRLHVKLVSFVLRALKFGAMQVVGHLPVVGRFVPKSSKDIPTIRNREEAIKYFQQTKGQIADKKSVGKLLQFILKPLCCTAMMANPVVSTFIIIGVIVVVIIVIAVVIGLIASG